MAATKILLNLINGCGIKKNIHEKYPLNSPQKFPRNYNSVLFATPQAKNRPIILPQRSKTENERSRFTLIKAKAELAELINNSYSITIEGEKLEKREEELSRATSVLWRAAKNIPLYPVALIPPTVASALAYWQTGQFSTERYLMILMSFVIVNIWIKLSNGVYDFDTGADKNKKESVINIFGCRSTINFIAWAAVLGVGFSGFTGLAVAAKSARALILLAAAVFCFYIYHCPPYHLRYDILGEPTLFTGFGPLATIGLYLLHSTASDELPISSMVIWSSILVGYTTTLIRFFSHFHKMEDDKPVGEISPLVRLGTEKYSKVLHYGVGGLYQLLFVLGFTKTLPLSSVILCAMTIPMGSLLVNFAEKNSKNKEKLFMSKYYCVGLHTLFGFALSAGLVIARLLARHPIML